MISVFPFGKRLAKGSATDDAPGGPVNGFTDQEHEEQEVLDMILVGCDFHSRYQQIRCVDVDISDLIERRLEHENGAVIEVCPYLSPGWDSGKMWTGILPSEHANTSKAITTSAKSRDI